LAKTNDITKPPSHLKAASKRWYSEVCEAFDLDSHHLRLLQLAAEAWDRGQEARAALAKEGIVYIDSLGMPKARPEVMIERDARLGFARILRELGLDVAGEPEPPRSPVLPANRRK
jgi:P27 family predicted phage terminase small subunit